MTIADDLRQLHPGRQSEGWPCRVWDLALSIDGVMIRVRASLHVLR